MVDRKKILFLVPPPLDGKPPAERIFGCNYGIYAQPNIFMLYPATVLKNAGHQVALLDCPIHGVTATMFDEFAQTQDYDVIFFYTVFLSKRTDLAARNLLRRHNLRTRFVFLSTEPTAEPEAFVDEASVVIRGESESRVTAVVEALCVGRSLEGIPGITWQASGRTVHQGELPVIEDLDALPFPDRTLLDSTDYHNPKLSALPFTTMVASRGCAFRCYYCVPNSQSFAREIEYRREHGGDKPPVRARSAENVIAEFTELARAGYKAISFIDDQFVWNPVRTRAICEGITGLGVQWSCLARSDMLQDRELVQAMARAGCCYVDIGIESFHQPILDAIGKNLKVETVYKAVRNLHEAGIEPELNILLASSPLETAETIEKTFQETLRLNVDYVLFSVCTPFPHTGFHEAAKREGWMIKSEYEPIDPIKESFVSYPHLTKTDLDRTIRSLYRRFYFRPGYLLRRLGRIQSPRDLWNKMKAAASILR